MLTALVTQQVYKQIHTLLLFMRPCVLMYSGPAKSTPVMKNGGTSLTRNSGNGGGTGEQYGLPSNLRHTDFCKDVPYAIAEDLVVCTSYN